MKAVSNIFTSKLLLIYSNKISQILSIDYNYLPCLSSVNFVSKFDKKINIALKKINSKFFLVIVTADVVINFVKFSIYFIQLITLKLFYNSYSRKKIKENVFLTHTFNQYHSVDNYFGKIKISLKKIKLEKNFETYFLNHSSSLNIAFKKNILSGLNLSYLEIIKLFFFLIKVFFFVLLKIFFERNKYLKKLLIYLLGNIMSISSFKAFLSINDFISEIYLLKAKRVFFTFEGHIYEKYLISKLKNESQRIETFGYFHTGITSGLNSYIIKNLKQFLPNAILCINKKNTFFFKKIFSISKVYNVGKILPLKNSKVNKWKFISNKNKKINCLILYENNFDQIQKLLADILLYKNIFNFSIRSHPEFQKNLQHKLIQSNLNIKLKISKNSNLEKDLENNHLIIYNSSSVVIESIIKGIFPFQLESVLHDTYSFFGSNNKFLITNLNELFIKMNLIKTIEYQKILKRVKKNFSEINTSILIQLFNK